MKKALLVLLALSLSALVGCHMQHDMHKKGQKCKRGQMLSHDVYFMLKDASPAKQKELVDACYRALSDMPGIVSFAAGSRAEQYKGGVHDLDFHVGLHIVFKNTKYYDEYEKAPKHLKLIDEYKHNWKKARVFDTLVR